MTAVVFNPGGTLKSPGELLRNAPCPDAIANCLAVGPAYGWALLKVAGVWASGQDGLTGIGSIPTLLSPETTKNPDTVYETLIFKALE